MDLNNSGLKQIDVAFDCYKANALNIPIRIKRTGEKGPYSHNTTENHTNPQKLICDRLFDNIFKNTFRGKCLKLPILTSFSELPPKHSIPFKTMNMAMFRYVCLLEYLTFYYKMMWLRTWYSPTHGN